MYVNERAQEFIEIFCREICFSGYVYGDIMTKIVSVYRNKIAFVDRHTGRVWNGQFKMTGDAKTISRKLMSDRGTSD